MKLYQIKHLVTKELKHVSAENMEDLMLKCKILKYNNYCLDKVVLDKVVLESEGREMSKESDKLSDNPTAAHTLAKMFHETYERLAPSFGYETRQESSVSWDKVPQKNKDLMIATCEVVIREAVFEEVIKSLESDGQV